jgi:hypothetical protein
MQISTKTGVVHAILSSFDVAEKNSAEAPGTAIPYDLICGDLARRIAVNNCYSIAAATFMGTFNRQFK